MATFKILSIDGGGIRGIIPAFWLTRLEAQLKARTKKSLVEVFDLIAGTSTGSIIAAGLVIGKSADEIRKTYERDGHKIFPKSVFPRVFRPLYGDEGLESLLEAEFQNVKLGEVQKRLLVTAFNGGNRTLKLFDSDKHDDKHYLLREVVRASCAAPVYLPAKQMKVDGVDRTLLDGGVAANNPAALALAKAFRLGHMPADVLLLSLGTGVSQQPITETEANRGWAQWVRPIVDVMFDGSSSTNEILIDHVLPEALNFRFQRRDLQCDAALDKTDAPQLRALQEEAEAYLTHEAVKFRQLVDALAQSEPPPALAIGGRWQSEYNWTEGGKLVINDWPEVVTLDVSGQIVTGYCKDCKYPFQLRGRILGCDVVGETRSLSDSYKRNGMFVVRLGDTAHGVLRGHWAGTGTEQLYSGEWTLTKLPH